MSLFGKDWFIRLESFRAEKWGTCNKPYGKYYKMGSSLMIILIKITQFSHKLLISIFICLKGSVTSLEGIKTNFFFLVFGQNFKKGAKYYLDMLFLNSCNFWHSTFVDTVIQGWKQGQESHYIQPRNLSSALALTNDTKWCNWADICCSVMH